MSKKNERYYKVHGVGQQRRYPSDKNKVDVVGSRFNVQFKGVQGQEVTMKEKKPTRTMPEKSMKTLKAKQHKFPVLKKVTRKEKLTNIKLRLLLLKYVYKWQRKTFGKISPSKARHHYQKKLLKSSFKQWEDVWWNGRNEWKLNIRADYHNRFRLWLKVWRGWRSFLIIKRIKKAKVIVAEQKADGMLLKKSLVSWKNYISKRKRKKQFYLQGQEEGKVVIKRMAFSKWKNSLKFKQELHLMEEQALHFWARTLFYKAWQCWLYKYSCALEEKHKIQYAVQLYNRKLAYKALQSFKFYGMQRNLKKLRLVSAIRFHRLNKIRDAFVKWRILWGRKRELMQFEDTVQCKGNEARKRRIFNHWKHYIILCQYKRHSECKARDHYETNIKIKCLRALKTRVEIQRRTAVFHVTATKFYKISLQRRIWMAWLRGCEERDDFRQITLINFVRNHYRKSLLRKVLNFWKCYCERRRLKQSQKLQADITARRNMLPRFFTRWETFVDLVKVRRINQERAEEFRRECLLAKTFYRWLQEYRVTLDIQMLYRMAIISYDEKLKKEFFQVWLTKARQRLRENRLLERGGDHYQLQLKTKCFKTWREYIKHLNHGSLQLNMAVHHQNKKLLSICWKYWTKFVLKKREKWKLIIKADLHFRHRILKKLIGTWKVYCNNVKEIKSFAEEKKTRYDKKTLRFLFNCWRENAQYFKTARENYHTSSQHWENKTMKRVFLAWRTYAENRSWKKHQEMCSIFEVRRQLDQGKLHRTLHVWKKQYLLKISSNEKWTKATEHWRKRVLQNAFDILKKYRFLGYRKQVLHQHCMFYHNDRITALHWRIWRTKYAERVTFLKKSRMALWMWSFTLQRKAFVSWFQYVAEKRRKKAAINKALERRQQWLHKVAVTQWIEFATFFIAERERFAALRHIQLSQNVQRSVQKCAMHWRRKTERNRGKIRPGAKQPSLIASHKAMSTENKRSTSKTHQPTVVRIASPIKRPQPRVPEYLRESFNLSELSDHIETEAVPRNFPLNFQPITQPEHFPEPTSCTSSTTSRASSNTSQTSSKETNSFNSSARNPRPFSAKSNLGKKHVLLPPSSFVPTKKPPNKVEAGGKQANEKPESTKVDEHPAEDGLGIVNNASSNDDPDSMAISRFLSDKNSQQSIVDLRNRMLKYYTISTQLRDSRRKLSCLRHWSRDSMADDEVLSADQKSLIEQIIKELSENVESTSYNLEESYKTISDDLQQLLDKVS